MLAAQGTLAAGGISNLASRNAAIANAVEQFGYVPDLAQLAQSLGMSQEDLAQALGPNAAQLAQEGTDAGLTTKARLNQANQDAVNQIKNELNKRGLLNSGETAYQLDRQNTSYRQAQYDATQKLLGYLQQYQQGYLNAQNANAQQLAQAYNDAATRQFNTNQGSAGTTAPFDHVDAQGNAVYRSPDGRLWNSDGTPYAGNPDSHQVIPNLPLPYPSINGVPAL